MAAYELGVALYAGSDGGGVSRHGNIAGEVRRHGRGWGCRPTTPSAPPPGGRASGSAGTPPSTEGAPADFVVYPRDPLTDLSVLREPSYVVLRGRAGCGARGGLKRICRGARVACGMTP